MGDLSAGAERLESLLRTLAETLARDLGREPTDPAELRWVIERIQDTFDTRAG
ncbi:MAG: hypothetical protein QN173_10745 [Armatimonadota bacterium]|nr:hypothetical protein [Armatimonadota bacterium]MDR7400836.1 hypothetical protein [Armatimonadota bacterium]MDR7404258.1 hypothetical protein [Armatimonadota bacterium]MDR7436571.1 hypothetical protein [Armatimonadota bacterium]MDR7473117.1 hypothetical protein [Armatimonadota bacterium]